jgi:23S rRNA pseudouridine2605 synthase
MRENNDKSKKFTLKDRKPVSQNHGDNSPRPERTERPKVDRSSDSGFKSERRSEGGGFNREKRSEGGFGSDRRSDDRRGGSNSGGEFNRERRSEGGGFNREKRSEGGFGRDRRSDYRRGGSSSGGGFNREKRSEGGFGRDRRSDDRSTGSSSGGGFNRERRSEGGGFNRERRSEGGFDRGDRREKPESFREEKPAKIKRIKRERTESKETRSGFGYKGSNRDFEKAGSHLQKGSELLNTDIRLNRYISNSGLCSRREADQMILEGLVMVNGNFINELGTKVSKKDVVKVDGKRIMPEKPIYILLNKPKGYITTTEDPEGRKTVMDLIDLPGKERIYPVGRLDRNTTGVLLLTNDGEFSQKLTHPSFQIKKIYRAKLDRKPSKEHMLAWVEGVELEDGIMTFEQVGFVDENDQTILGLEVHSGRNRVVRRMFEHFKYEVEALDRVLMGEFDKIKLGRGKWRLLNDKETAYIERLKRTKPKAPPTDLKSDPTSLDFSDEEWDDMMNDE